MNLNIFDTPVLLEFRDIKRNSILHGTQPRGIDRNAIRNYKAGLRISNRGSKYKRNDLKWYQKDLKHLGLSLRQSLRSNVKAIDSSKYPSVFTKPKTKEPNTNTPAYARLKSSKQPSRSMDDQESKVKFSKSGPRRGPVVSKDFDSISRITGKPEPKKTTSGRPTVDDLLKLMPTQQKKISKPNPNNPQLRLF